MKQNIFQPQEVVSLTKQYHELPSPESEDEVEELEPVYSGPTPEEIEKQARQTMMDMEARQEQRARQLHDEISELEKQRDQARADVQESAKELEKELLAQREQEGKELFEKESVRAQSIIDEAQKEAGAVTDKAHGQGYDAGYQEGYDAGMAEASRLMGTVQSAVSSLIDKRKEVVSEAETQLIELVLASVQKVVKVITEQSRQVVMQNVRQALSKLRSSGSVTLRVSLEEADLVREKKEQFLTLFDKVKDLKVIEDSSVGLGGVLVETDFGEIDARISSQLSEISTKIASFMPIKGES